MINGVVKTENIKVGDVYNNYGLLCAALGEEKKTGDSKIAQLENWKRYFNYARDGYKFIITSIKDKDDVQKKVRKDRDLKTYKTLKDDIHIISLILATVSCSSGGAVDDEDGEDDNDNNIQTLKLRKSSVELIYGYYNAAAQNMINKLNKESYAPTKDFCHTVGEYYSSVWDSYTEGLSNNRFGENNKIENKSVLCKYSYKRGYNSRRTNQKNKSGADNQKNNKNLNQLVQDQKIEDEINAIKAAALKEVGAAGYRHALYLGKIKEYNKILHQKLKDKLGCDYIKSISLLNVDLDAGRQILQEFQENASESILERYSGILGKYPRACEKDTPPQDEKCPFEENILVAAYIDMIKQINRKYREALIKIFERRGNKIDAYIETRGTAADADKKDAMFLEALIKEILYGVDKSAEKNEETRQNQSYAITEGISDNCTSTRTDAHTCDGRAADNEIDGMTVGQKYTIIMKKYISKYINISEKELYNNLGAFIKDQNISLDDWINQD